MTTTREELEAAERAYRRLRPELESLNVAELSPLSADVASAASLALSVMDRLRAMREQLAKLPRFDLRNVDYLADYARAAWFAATAISPSEEAASPSTDELALEVAALRAKLLMWATPLVGSGILEEATVARFKGDSGLLEGPTDLVALLRLFRSRWDEVKGICGVTEADLERAARIGPELLARLSQRDVPSPSAASSRALRVQRAWTLLDRAYASCRRAVWYLRGEDVSSLLPALHRPVVSTAPQNEHASSSGPFPAAYALESDGSIPTLVSALPPSSDLHPPDVGVPFGAGS